MHESSRYFLPFALYSDTDWLIHFSKAAAPSTSPNNNHYSRLLTLTRADIPASQPHNNLACGSLASRGLPGTLYADSRAKKKKWGPTLALVSCKRSMPDPAQTARRFFFFASRGPKKGQARQKLGWATDGLRRESRYGLQIRAKGVEDGLRVQAGVFWVCSVLLSTFFFTYPLRIIV